MTVGEISINKSVFDAMVMEITNAKNNLVEDKIPTFKLKITDVNCMEEQLKVIEDLQNVFNLYNEFLETDLKKLQTIGDSMVQHDEHLANQIKNK